MKCNETLSKWCKNKHGVSKIIDTFETYQGLIRIGFQSYYLRFQKYVPAAWIISNVLHELQFVFIW
jgi:hypothetical protein